MPRDLPARPHLDHLRKEAKSLLRDARQGDAAAIERLRTLASLPARAIPRLADAQLAIAREYGFSSWPKLKAHVESLVHDDPMSALAAAIRSNDAALVRRVLVRHPAVRSTLDAPLPDAGFGTTALLAAVERSNRDMVDALLDAGANIEQRSHWWAGSFGVLDEAEPGLVPHLRSRGARLDAHSAARLDMVDELRAIIAADAEVVHARGPDGQTPLHLAATIETAQLLLDHGADIDALDVDHESTPAQYMLRSTNARAQPRDRRDVARFLVARGCRTDILMAAALGDAPLVRRHLDADPASIRTSVSLEHFPKRDPRSGGTIYIWVLGWHRTPHRVAREFGHEDVLALLMERSPEELRLAQAAELGDEETVRAMLARRPDVARAVPRDDRRRLADAAQNDNGTGVRLMLGAGWPADARGQHGATALHWASWHGNADMVRDLLRHRAPLDARDEQFGTTAMQWALHGSRNSWHRETGDYGATVEALLDAGAAAPPLTEDLEASEPVREILRRHAGGT